MDCCKVYLYFRTTFGRRFGFDIEAQPDLLEANPDIRRNAERPTQIDVAFRGNGGRFERDIEHGGSRFERHARTGDERFEQHVSGAQVETGAAFASLL